jgi:hypothetical protein
LYPIPHTQKPIQADFHPFRSESLILQLEV